jgi:hypothetical protein
MAEHLAQSLIDLRGLSPALRSPSPNFALIIEKLGFDFAPLRLETL